MDDAMLHGWVGGRWGGSFGARGGCVLDALFLLTPLRRRPFHPRSCIPVLIMDEVQVSFESVVDLSTFTIRIPEADAEKLPDILQAVTQERREEMQRALARVWQRFTYSSYLPYARQFRDLQQQHAAQRPAHGGGADAKPMSLPEAAVDVDPAADDAFGTIMAWLHSRIEATQ